MITAHIASIPDREQSLQMVVNAIAPQVNRTIVALNGYTEVPEWLRNMRNVDAEILDNSLKDCAKFLHINDEKGVCFVLDDDLIVPSHYVRYLFYHLQEYGGAVSLHGRIYPRPIEHFRRWVVNCRCLGTVKENMTVDLIGTGCMAFDNTDIGVDDSVFEYPGMADITFSRLCHRQGKRMTVLAHPAHYLTYIAPQSTIWRTTRDFSLHNKLLNEFLCPNH